MSAELSRLAESYDSTDVQLFRWSDNRAVIVVDVTAMALVAADAAHLPEFPHKDVVDGWLRSDPRAIGSCSLGRLLTWASKRPPRNEIDPGSDDYAFMLAREAFDIQLAHDVPFNRRLIREALQTLVELDYNADIHVVLEITQDHQGRPQLRMTVGDLTLYVMACNAERIEGEVGNDPMPGTWEASP